MFILLGPLILVSALAIGWRCSTMLHAEGTGAEHLERAWVFGLFSALACTRAMLWAGAYGPLPALVLCGLAGWFAFPQRASLFRYLGTIPTSFRRLSPWTQVAMGAFIWLVALGAARTSRFGPTTWDSMTYHLVHAVRWRQTGTWGFDPSPGAWSYYEGFPTGGDAFWSWLMLGDGSADALYLGAFVTYLALLFTTFRAARTVGMTRNLAMDVSLMGCLAGSSICLTDAQYVDVLLTSIGMTGFTSSIRWWQQGRDADLVGLGAALALAVAIKTSSMVWLPPVVLFLVLRGVRTRTLAVGLTPLLVELPAWIRRATIWDNPLYPADFPLLGRGSILLEQTLTGHLRGLEISWTDRLYGVAEMLGLGTTFPLAGYSFIGLPVLIVAGSGWIRRTRRSLDAVTVIGLGTVFPSLYLLMAGPSGLFVLWANNGGRLLLPGWLVLCFGLAWAAPTHPLRAAVAHGVTGVLLVGAAYGLQTSITLALQGEILLLLGAALRIGGIVAWVRCAAFINIIIGLLASGDASFTHYAGLWIVMGFAVSAVLWSTSRPLRVAGALGLVIPAVTVRGGLITEAVDTRRSFGDREVPTQVWDWLFEAPSATIAVAAHFNPALHGHDVFRYPLMGRWGQHALTYVPPPPDGDPMTGHAWRKAVREAGIDLVFVQGKDMPERRWAEGDPAFVMVAQDPPAFTLYRVAPRLEEPPAEHDPTP